MSYDVDIMGIGRSGRYLNPIGRQNIKAGNALVAARRAAEDVIYSKDDEGRLRNPNLLETFPGQQYRVAVAVVQNNDTGKVSEYRIRYNHREFYADKLTDNRGVLEAQLAPFQPFIKSLTESEAAYAERFALWRIFGGPFDFDGGPEDPVNIKRVPAERRERIRDEIEAIFRKVYGRR